MSRINSVLVAGICVALLSCKHNDRGRTDPNPTDPNVFMTIDVDPNLSGTPEAWVFATDGNGKVLDIQQNLGQPLKLRSETAVPDTVTVTFFYVQLDNLGEPGYSLTSYGDIPKNSVITARGDTTSYQQIVELGLADFTLTGTPAPEMTTFSDGYATWRPTYQDNGLHQTVHLYTGHPDFIVSAVRDEVSVYAWFTDVNGGDSRGIDLSELAAFPKTTAFSYSGDAEILADIKGFKALNQYYGYQFGNFVDHQASGMTSMNLGYLDDYLFYETEALAAEHFDGNTIRVTRYFRRGSPVASIELPPSNFTITDTTMQNFSFTFTGRVDFKQAGWAYQLPGGGGVGWLVNYVGNAPPKIVDFPDTLKSKFADLDLSQFQFGQSTLYQSLDGYTYPEYIRDYFNFRTMKGKEYNSFMHN